MALCLCVVVLMYILSFLFVACGDSGSYPAVVTIVRAGEILEIGFYKGDVR